MVINFKEIFLKLQRNYSKISFFLVSKQWKVSLMPANDFFNTQLHYLLILTNLDKSCFFCGGLEWLHGWNKLLETLFLLSKISGLIQLNNKILNLWVFIQNWRHKNFLGTIHISWIHRTINLGNSTKKILIVHFLL